MNSLALLIPLYLFPQVSVEEARDVLLKQAADSYAELADWAFEVGLYRECAYLVREVGRVYEEHEVEDRIKDIEKIDPETYVENYKVARKKYRRKFAKRRDSIATPVADGLVALAVKNEVEAESLYVEAIRHMSEHKAANKALKKLDYDVVFNYGVLPKEDKESARETLRQLRGGFLGSRDLNDELEFWSDAWGLETRNYRFVTNAPHATVFAFAQACEDLFEAWEQVIAPGKLSLRRMKDPAVIYFFDSPATYQAILRSTEVDVPSADEVLGYYSPSTKIGYFYDKPAFYAGDLTLLFETFYHEGTHQLEDLRIKAAWRGTEAKYPLGWLGEGFALYMELLEITQDGDRRTFRLGGFVDDDLGTGLDGYLGDHLMDSREFVHLSRSEFMDYSLGYPHAALLTHFLMESEDGRHRKALLSLVEEVRAKGGIKKPLWQHLGVKEEDFFEALDVHARQTLGELPRRKYKE